MKKTAPLVTFERRAFRSFGRAAPSRMTKARSEESAAVGFPPYLFTIHYSLFTNYLEGIKNGKNRASC